MMHMMFLLVVRWVSRKISSLPLNLSLYYICMYIDFIVI